MRITPLEMNLRTTLLSIIIGTALWTATSANATTTLRFSVTGTNRATGFSDNLGAAGVDGMRWGIVIDTAGNGFQGGAYDLFDSSTPGFLQVSSVATDDYYYTSAVPPTTATLTATGSDPGGSGGISSLASAPNGTDGIIPGVTTGDLFSIIWFVTTPNASGTYYGMMPDPSFTIPASGSLVDRNTPFLGSSPDPIKPATFQFGTPIPEPSRLMLLGLGALGIFGRRRRS